MQEPELEAAAFAPLVARHMRLGWGALCVFVLGGIALETLHAYKLGFYLDVGNETRRLMWTLAHAHGVGLGLLNIAYAATLQLVLRASATGLRVASVLLCAATLLIPIGFALGGVVTYGGDPGVLVLFVPAGALMLLVAVGLVTRALFAGPRSGA
jgi:hypothetical protein